MENYYAILCRVIFKELYKATASYQKQ